MFVQVENLASDSQIRVVTLNRPDVKNAFNAQMIQEITQIFHKLNEDTSIKAIVLKGAGTAFCSGADLAWMKDMVNYSFEENIKDSEKLWEMFEAIAFCSAPVIGVVHGAAFGGAIGLVAACDYVFSEENMKYCFSEVKVGLAPAVISSFILRKVSESHVRALMISGDVFTTAKTEIMGLTHTRFSGEANLENMMKTFSTNGIEAMKATKKLLNDISKADWSNQKKITTKVISERRISAEGQARLKKYLDKT